MNLLIRIYISILAMAISLMATAFPIDTYASHSALAEGTWVKVAVTETGMHKISATQLRTWGFTNPAKVKVYGYGGARLSDQLTQANYIDDLPQLQQVTGSDGSIYFYAVGPTTWKSAVTGRYYPSQNPFSTAGYYFLSDRDALDREIPTMASVTSQSQAATTFNERLFHETDQVSIAQTGHYLVGEDMRYTPSRTFSFDLTDCDQDSVVWMQTNLASAITGATGLLKFTANGTALTQSSTDIVRAYTGASYVYAVETVTRKTFNVSSDKLQLGVTLSSSGTISSAYLDFIAINYSRKLKLNNGRLNFYLDTPAGIISEAPAGTYLWDVTKPLAIEALPTQSTGTNTLKWVNEYTGTRSYAAWTETGTFPSPTFVERVDNQDLHALPTPKMVIFTVPELKTQAERLADIHRAEEGFTVEVIDQDLVYNEFSSGTPDVVSFRKLLKMFYDRGESADSLTSLEYVCFFGRHFYDNRRLTTEGKNLNWTPTPTWEAESGIDDNTSYVSDDHCTFLADNSGVTTSSDKLCVAVGRIPVTSLTEATAWVDKYLSYLNSSTKGDWKNHIFMLADDKDSGVHMTQMNDTRANMLATDGGSNFFYDMVYTDEYEQVGSAYPQARTNMFHYLDEGKSWWFYIGHGNYYSLTHEKILTSDDIATLYLKKIPVMYAATCDFARCDNSEPSGAERLLTLDGGGVMAICSATRPVYIADNGLLTKAVGKTIFSRNTDGSLPRVGQVIQRAKNSLGSNSNKLRYVLMGDPAMKVTYPDNILVIDKVDGHDIDPDNPPTLATLESAVLEGYVTNGRGELLPDFNGVIQATLYDAEESVTTRGNKSADADDGKPITFDRQGSRLYAASDSIINGRFSVTIKVPGEIVHNYRPAAVNLYAYSSNDEAIGCFRDIYVYGFGEDNGDDTPPVIESFYLNHPTFTDGTTVNPSPMAIAEVSDDVAINLSSAGIGHQMTLTLDGSTTYNDVSNYFTPSASRQGAGTINYPLENLLDGEHTLRLRVFDSSANLAEQTITFKVDAKESPSIIDVYTDANPASSTANFYVSHNRPDAMVTVSVTVYNLLGRMVWSSSASGRSDMFPSCPLTWDLTDQAGRRVQRGIYLYKATLTTDGVDTSSSAKRIAVTGH